MNILHHINRARFLALAWAAFALIFSACGSDDDAGDGPEPQDQVSTLSMMVHPEWNGAPLAYGADYRTEDGQLINFETAQLYLSEFELLKAGGETVMLDTFFLITREMRTFDLGEVPAGDYEGVRFYVGIDSVRNHADPSQYPNEHPLALQTPSMHWSWNSGYIFLKIDAEVDTTEAQDGSGLKTAAFHIGMDQFRTPVSLTKATQAPADGGATLHVKIDWREALRGLDLRTENHTMTMNNMPLARKVADNIPGMFEIAEH